MTEGNGSYPADLKYTREHEWVAVQGKVGTIGITQYAQSELGDIVYVELPKIGTQVVAGERFGTVESVKAVSELYAPASGEVIEVNAALSDTPETLNQDPYAEGWIVKITIANPDEIGTLLSAADYRKHVEDEAN
ncbi:MAG: glycine cleavage system protein GcvH [Acidobacteriota bacterium]